MTNLKMEGPYEEEWFGTYYEVLADDGEPILLINPKYPEWVEKVRHLIEKESTEENKKTR